VMEWSATSPEPALARRLLHYGGNCQNSGNAQIAQTTSKIAQFSTQSFSQHTSPSLVITSNLDDFIFFIKLNKKFKYH